MNIFDEINTEIEKKENKATELKEIIFPQAYQIRKTIKKNGQTYEEIVDTYCVNRESGITPVNKAKSKAKKLSEITKISHYVVEICHKIIASY